GRSLLHQGGNNQNLAVGGDTVAQELTEVVAEKFQVPPPVCCKKSRKSKISPPSFWDAVGTKCVYINTL
ncbi:hypothetical protein A2U01_0097662, partial [Trifolium medium]|nr:hypothetical protein [Trifolium medium]